MTRKAFLTIFIILTLLLPLCLQAKSFLWEIDTPGGKKSYLLGSTYMLNKSAYPLAKAIEKAYTDSEILVVEVNLTAEKFAQLAKDMLEKSMYPGKETIKDNVSEEVYLKLEEKLKELELNIDWFKKYKPWMVTATVFQQKMMKMGFSPQYSIDIHFMTRAAKEKKKIIELEGIKQHINLLNSLSKEENEFLLLSTVKKIDNFEKEMDKTISAWNSGDVDSIKKYKIDEYQDFPTIKKKLLDDRNNRMIKKITSLLKSSKSHLVIIGILQIVGEKGLLKLLEKEGFTLKQL